jgi:hypothetical protein
MPNLRADATVDAVRRGREADSAIGLAEEASPP